MRSGRSLLVLLLIAAGLGAYIYFVEMERDPAGTEAKAKVFTVDVDAIEELEVKVPGGTATSLKRTGTTWNVTAPVAVAADSAAVSSITGALSTMEIDTVLEENATAFGPFGLETPTVTVSFKAAGDTTTRAISLGAKAPTGSGVYARIEGQPRLFLVPSFHEDSLKKSTFDLRDKRLLTLDREAIDSVTLTGKNSKPLALARKGSDWRLSAPLDAKADFSPTDNLLNRLTQANMTSVVAEGAEPTAAELRTYGLDAPALVATIGAGSARTTLALGARRDETSVYARDPNRALIFTVESTLLTDLTKTPDDLRVKTAFEFQSFSAVSLDITRGGSTTLFGKQKPAAATDASAPEVWAITKPAAKEVNQTAMTDLLNTLSSLRVDKFVGSAPASGDDMAVVARFGDAAAPQTDTVTLRKVGSTLYVIRAGEPGAGVASSAEFDKAVTQLQALTSGK